MDHGSSHHLFHTTVSDATKLKKMLENPRAPLVKKRQIMRNTFGDYRKKMALQEKKSSKSRSCQTFKPLTSFIT